MGFWFLFFCGEGVMDRGGLTFISSLGFCGDCGFNWCLLSPVFELI